jgi:hypothetical protein
LIDAMQENERGEEKMRAEFWLGNVKEHIGLDGRIM